MVAHTCNPSFWQAQPGELGISGQDDLCLRKTKHWACLLLPGMMANSVHPTTLEAEAGGSLWIQGKAGLHSETHDCQVTQRNPVSEN